MDTGEVTAGTIILPSLDLVEEVEEARALLVTLLDLAEEAEEAPPISVALAAAVAAEAQ